MKLIKYTIKVPSVNEDVIVASLCDVGIEGVEIDDKIPLNDEELSQMFVDIPKETEDDGEAFLHFYLDDDDDETVRILSDVRQELEELKNLNLLEDTTIEKTDISKVNWQDNWKKYFKAFDIENLTIVPVWEDYKDYKKTDNIIIRIDPGSAFGTGKHETTKLCIKEMLNMDLNNCNILDLGTGSGILGIAALRLKAKMVTAVDIDSNVLSSVNCNLINNDISGDEFTLKIGDIAQDKELFYELKENMYDLIVANILPDVLYNITPFVKELMNKNTLYLLSGILDIKVPYVEEFLKQNEMRIVNKTDMGEWVSITAKLK